MTTAAETALVAHIISQIEQNVHFLASQNYITAESAGTILSHLPTGAPGARMGYDHGGSQEKPSAMAQLTSKFSGLMSSASARPASAAPRPVPAPPPTHGNRVQQARAIWGYNEDGSDPNDLVFSPGDVIEIIEETNADWWKGRFNGREGLVPANYVEKLAAPYASPPAVSSSAYKPAGKPYKPFGAAMHGMDKPPPAGQGVNSLGLQQRDTVQEERQKKEGLGKYKDTLAHSAAGGVGFGAGAAIGGGLVRAIF